MMLGLGYTINLSGPDAVFGVADPYPASIDVFTDSGSLFHLAAGVVIGLLATPWNVGLLAAFSAYELSKAATGEPWTRTGGKFAELALGVIAGKMVAK
jgi:hypothetical protein